MKKTSKQSYDAKLAGKCTSLLGKGKAKHGNLKMQE